MKRTLVAILILAVAVSFYAATPQPKTGVNNTYHDLSRNNTIAYASSGGPLTTNRVQSCWFCHTPHGAPDGTSPNLLAALWSHSITTVTYKMYTNANVPVADLQGTVSTTGPMRQSLACLSCHDGTVAVGALLSGRSVSYNQTSTVIDTTGHLVDGFGSDLTTVHPISITYQNDLDLGLKDPTGFPTTKYAKLFPNNVTGSRVECASCHDVHNYGERYDRATNTGYGDGPFLRDTMGNGQDTTSTSKLCLDCHLK